MVWGFANSASSIKKTWVQTLPDISQARKLKTTLTTGRLGVQTAPDLHGPSGIHKNHRVTGKVLPINSTEKDLLRKTGNCIKEKAKVSNGKKTTMAGQYAIT